MTILPSIQVFKFHTHFYTFKAINYDTCKNKLTVYLVSSHPSSMVLNMQIRFFLNISEVKAKCVIE